MGLFGYDVPYIITYTDYCDHDSYVCDTSRVYEKKVGGTSAGLLTSYTSDSILNVWL